MNDNFPKLITIKEASEILCVTEKSVREYIHKGYIIGYKFERALRVDKDSLIKFLNDSKIIGGIDNE
ncbi:helix-turn-helix domain-containing protein [Clostridioides difficile]|uniref:helix-turn-helix domain-containing protein n=1 Tax=Clostridioides difficile TaxID=1496 RepID=UPI0008A3A2BF|nr:helix-turn-helix domain-containing protein [Clostridioides difficile]OFU26258.1 hypothetical protein HMPREF3075_17970 [Clostridium sp. HMSC19B11]MBF4710555.1 helix-turn-helix domain-containing protein [Clostridioides difficile]MBY1443976.1 helix-turn-helix domain-containing protein [Clostridioides difficile]MBY1488967.1 helix-turn-helix domain-containing protein [Clostridioides difficile]MBY1863118.1 helix-turn-helix domain-containing protein [Clostridioides difficile]